MASILRGYSNFLERTGLFGQMITAASLWSTGDILCQYITRPTAPTPTSTSPPSTSGNRISAQAAISKDLSFPLSQITETVKASNTAAIIPRSSTFEIDYKRVAIMATFGFCMAGPAYTYWYRFLDKHVVSYTSRVLKKQQQLNPTLNVSKINMAWKIAIIKVALDDFVFEPIYLPAFFTSTGLLSGNTVTTVTTQIKNEFWHTYFIDLLLWTPVQLINFRWIPLLYQPVLVNCVNIGW
ncbi:hypothetical protein SmJEL517_g02525 [Synchytrium microbalum]|uniref:Protein Mpv17 n=1 Tax=Synchytrium microbalum TaxID=1806994 RepID=A0A507C6G0_9FUNG|nr:uncharacterized protein SmJEL517_g02525 [Synchytrium microbalum]TPX35091.1 hypothetical protein SmJEL517_g02525 [Synchytrium microbalum]